MSRTRHQVAVDSSRPASDKKVAMRARSHWKNTTTSVYGEKKSRKSREAVPRAHDERPRTNWPTGAAEGGEGCQLTFRCTREWSAEALQLAPRQALCCIEAKEQVLVYDLGGGTFEVSCPDVE